METENLVKMANNICNYFQSEPDQTVAIHGAVDHITKFWEKRMRLAIARHYQAGGEGLCELGKKVIARLVELQPDLVQ